MLHIFGHNILKSADRHLVDPSVSFQLVLSEDGSGWSFLSIFWICIFCIFFRTRSRPGSCNCCQTESLTRQIPQIFHPTTNHRNYRNLCPDQFFEIFDPTDPTNISSQLQSQKCVTWKITEIFAPIEYLKSLPQTNTWNLCPNRIPEIYNPWNPWNFWQIQQLTS